MKFTRRSFIKTVAGVSGATLLGPRRRGAIAGSRPRALSRPEQSGIDHIVVVMMENRSFDHLFGWHPNADGMQAGLTYLDPSGVPHDTYPLAPDYTGCGHPDPDHSWEGGRIQRHDGAMDGFLLGLNDIYSIGYYVEEDRPFFSALARNFTTLDRSFCSILGPTFPNRLFMHAAQTDRLSNTFVLATMPTIWDALAAAGVEGRYYYGNLPFLGLWGDRYLGISRTNDLFLMEAQAGQLAPVSFLDPTYTLDDSRPGPGDDDHPHADIRRGDAFLARAFHAVATGPLWSRTVFIVNFDEWGGFFDHVPPPRAAAPNTVDPDIDADGRALLGLRVPTVIASPFTAGEADNPRVQSAVFDHTSVLKLIEWRWGLNPLTARDSSDDVGNILSVLDLENPNPGVPDLPLPEGPPPAVCPPPVPGAEQEPSGGAIRPESSTWAGLASSGLLDGWPIRGG